MRVVIPSLPYNDAAKQVEYHFRQAWHARMTMVALVRALREKFPNDDAGLEAACRRSAKMNRATVHMILDRKLAENMKEIYERVRGEAQIAHDNGEMYVYPELTEILDWYK